MPRKADPDFDALVNVTHANVAMERGRLNIALKAIKVAWENEGGLPDGLAAEIGLRAEAYRNLWPGMALTPTALAVHWSRVIAEASHKGKTPQKALDELRKEKE